ncbi:MAG: type I secretion system permease/ATPase [Alphaproteobacteria bacterium]|nr:type I secretion system permease/ATPase [Alphaproteobacteria bacterium]
MKLASNASPGAPTEGLRAAADPRPAPAGAEGAWDDALLGCLTIVTALLGKPTSIETLRAGLPLHDAGMSVGLFVRAARRAGFAARAARRRSIEEIATANLPCVLVLRGGRACVLARRTGDTLTVLEPDSAGGERNLELGELAPLFDGTAIFVRPLHAPDARAGHALPPTRGDWFWSAIAELWPIYGHVFVAAFAINVLGLAGSVYAMNVYDRVVPNNATETLWVLTLGVLLVYVFDVVLRTARAYFVDAAGKGADAVIGARLFEQVMAIRLEARPASTGALASTLRDYESLREFFTSATLVAVIDLPFVALYIVVAWLIAGPVAWVALAAVPVVLAFGLALQLPLARAVERNQAEAAQKHAILVEAIEGLETLKVARAEGRTQGLWERFVAASARSSMASRVYATLAINFTAFATSVASALVILLGVHEIGAGRLTMGALIAATILTGRALAPLGQVAALVVRVNQSLVALRALDKLMAAPRERDAAASYVSRPGLRGQVALQELSFAYPPTAGSLLGLGAPVALSGLNLFIDAGERVGIVGRVGSGKSTIARLIAGLYQPTSGAVLIDGTDIRQLDPAELRRQIGYVPQDAFLVFGSVKDNIVIGAPGADDEALLRAATIAGVDDFVKARPQGYDLPVGERGQYLSGGQRAAVTIARALVTDPPILLFDEPTGEMDSTSEQRLKARLAQILPGRTLILITHRGSMLSLVDRLVVVDQGRIVADGPKDKVLEELQGGGVRGAARIGP